MKPNSFHRRMLMVLVAAVLILPAPVYCRSAEEDPGGNRLRVVDCVGRTVELPDKMDKIACLYAFTGHVVTMLGRGPDIVAVSYGLKRDSLLHLICPSILKARVPKAQGAINMEELMLSAPDVLFMPGDVAADPADTAKLARFQIPYLVIDYKSIHAQQQAVLLIGDAIGTRERAAEFVAYYQEMLDRVRHITNEIPEDERLRVYYAVNEPLRTTMIQGLETDWLKVTGCENVALTRDARIIEGKNYTSLEQLLIWNPDVILANEPGSAAFMLQDDKWSTLKAVQTKRVFQMPIGISRWGHPGSIETPLAVVWTAKTLYPDRFAHVDMVVEIRAFYNRFFNYALSDDMLEKMVSGKNVRKPKKGVDQ